MAKRPGDERSSKHERKAAKREAMAGKFSEPHPKLALLREQLPPGRYAGGTIIVTEPDAHHEEMSKWLTGNVEGRVALGRTAFGDIIVFRDLRKKADSLGLPNAEEACDVALIDLNFKQMQVLAYSADLFLAALHDAEFQNEILRKELYDEVKARLGDYGDDEAYGFVPALALGGEERAESVEKVKWQPYQDLLFQL